MDLGIKLPLLCNKIDGNNLPIIWCEISLFRLKLMFARKNCVESFSIVSEITQMSIIRVDKKREFDFPIGYLFEQ